MASPKSPVALVRGGTHTTAHDNAAAERLHDAEQRRAVFDRETAAAANPDGQGSATLYTHNLADNGPSAKAPVAVVVCDVLNRHGQPTHDGGVPVQSVIDVDLVAEPAFFGEQMLVMFCPRCVERGEPAQDCIIQVRQSNKAWELDARGAGEQIQFLTHNDSGVVAVEHFISAGTIIESERFTCARCEWTARITENRIWPD